MRKTMVGEGKEKEGGGMKIRDDIKVITIHVIIVPFYMD